MRRRVTRRTPEGSPRRHKGHEGLSGQRSRRQSSGRLTTKAQRTRRAEWSEKPEAEPEGSPRRHKGHKGPSGQRSRRRGPGRLTTKAQRTRRAEWSEKPEAGSRKAHREGTKDTKGRVVREAGGMTREQFTFRPFRPCRPSCSLCLRGEPSASAFSGHAGLRVLCAFVVSLRFRFSGHAGLRVLCAFVVSPPVPPSPAMQAFVSCAFVVSLRFRLLRPCRPSCSLCLRGEPSGSAFSGHAGLRVLCAFVVSLPVPPSPAMQAFVSFVPSW